MLNCGCYIDAGINNLKKMANADSKVNTVSFAYFTERIKNKPDIDTESPLKEEKRGFKSWSTRRMLMTTIILLLVLCIGIALCLIVYFTDEIRCGKTRSLNVVVNSVALRNIYLQYTAGEAKLCTSGSAVAFTVSVKNHQVIIKANETLHFEDVSTNVGSAFYQPTGIFTAPAGGMYVFDLSLAAKGNQKVDFWIVKNGNRLKRLFLAGYGLNWITTSTATTVRLKEGDKVWVKSNKYVGELIGNGLTSFSGFLINPVCQTNF